MTRDLEIIGDTHLSLKKKTPWKFPSLFLDLGHVWSIILQGKSAKGPWRKDQSLPPAASHHPRHWPFKVYIVQMVNLAAREAWVQREKVKRGNKGNIVEKAL